MPKILVVDDEPDLVELVAFNLQQEGFEVLTAANGWEAVEKARAALPDPEASAGCRARYRMQEYPRRNEFVTRAE